jgi:hypothetical protein
MSFLAIFSTNCVKAVENDKPGARASEGGTTHTSACSGGGGTRLSVLRRGATQYIWEITINQTYNAPYQKGTEK